MKYLIVKYIVTLTILAAFQSNSLNAQQHQSTNEIANLYHSMTEIITDYPTEISELEQHISSPFTQTTSKSFYLGYPLYSDVDYSNIPDPWRGSITSSPPTDSVALHDANLIHCQRIGELTRKAIKDNSSNRRVNIWPKAFLNDLGPIPDEAIAMQRCIIRKTITAKETREELYGELVAAIGRDLKLQTLTTDQQKMADRYPENFWVYYGNGPFHRKGAVVTWLSAVIGLKQPDTKTTQIWLEAVSYLLPPSS